MLSVAQFFVLKGLAPLCPLLKGVFVAVVFRRMESSSDACVQGVSYQGSCHALLISGPKEFLNPSQHVLRQLLELPQSKRTMIGIHREKHSTVKFLFQSEQHKATTSYQQKSRQKLQTTTKSQSNQTPHSEGVFSFFPPVIRHVALDWLHWCASSVLLPDNLHAVTVCNKNS